MNILIAFASRILTVLILLFTLCVFLLGTTTGLRTVIWIVKHQIPGTLQIDDIEGHLIDKISFKALTYQSPQVNVHVGQGELIVQELWPHPTAKIKAYLYSPIQTELIAMGTISGFQSGQLKITLSPSGASSAIPFNGGSFTLDLNPTGLHADGKIFLDKAHTGILTADLPRFNLRHIQKQQPIQGAFNLDFPSLDFLNLTQDNMIIRGQIHANLAANGTLSSPNLTGTITLNQGELGLTDWGINLHPINLVLKTQDKHWQATGSIITSPQKETLTLTGHGEFSPILSGQWALKGEHILLINTPEYKIRVSPNLLLDFKQNAYILTGLVSVPEAEIKPITFSNTVTLTDDAVFVSATPQHTLPLNLTTNLTLEMGNAVTIDLKGLHGYLIGSVKLNQKPLQPLTADGILTLREGRYQSYGQQLKLEDSQLIFSGETLTNPKAHIRALREINQTKTTAADVSQLFNFKSDNLQNIAYEGHIRVGIDINGRIKNPKVTLFSSPASLSQADILSFLLLGKPASQASKSGGQLLVSAVNGLNMESTSKGAQLLQDLKSRIPIDIDIQNNSTSSSLSNSLSPGTTVGIGKSITDRAYLHYAVDVFQDNSNVLTLTYLLNKFFSIQVSASDIGNGIDLLYTHSEP
jgi:translocation and assembly module TamB